MSKNWFFPLFLLMALSFFAQGREKTPQKPSIQGSNAVGKASLPERGFSQQGSSIARRLSDRQKSLYRTGRQLSNKQKRVHQNTLKTLWMEKKSKEKNTPSFRLEILAQGLGVPWGMAFLNKNELIVTEREGTIKKIHLPTGTITPVTGGPQVYARGQGGLLDVALHPEFKKNKWIYLTYSISRKGKHSTALARGQLKGNKIKKLKILFTVQPFYTGNRHFGSRLVFDSRGFLFMTVGDRARRPSAQNLSSHTGKLLRLDSRGRAGAGNPFAKTKGARPEIWSYGHRNPQGLFIHPETEEIYLQEHGPKGGDEINLIKKGGNYGWPVITHGRAYTGLKIGEGTYKEGMEQPIKYWTPSIAPCGLLIYSGKKFPQWQGDFFSGALALTHLNQLKFRDEKVVDEKRWFSSLGFRFRHVIEGPQGFIYVSVDRGMILRIRPL